MRSAFLLSFVTAAVIGLLSLARQQTDDRSPRPSRGKPHLAGSEDEAYLFVG